MKIKTAALVIIVAIALVGTALAVPPGKTSEWETKMGTVIFDGKKHADKGVKCMECHPKIFQMKKGTTEMTMKDLNAGKFCGTCHNGERAFKTSEGKNCKTCHIKKK